MVVMGCLDNYGHETVCAYWDESNEECTNRLNLYGDMQIISVGFEYEHIPYFGKTVFHTRAEAEAALSAEGVEEMDRCMYCSPKPYGHGEAIENLISQRFRDKAHIHTYISGDAIHTFAYPSPSDTKLAKTYSGCCIINYCPMCGRALKQEQEDSDA